MEFLVVCIRTKKRIVIRITLTPNETGILCTTTCCDFCFCHWTQQIILMFRGGVYVCCVRATLNGCQSKFEPVIISSWNGPVTVFRALVCVCGCVYVRECWCGLHNDALLHLCTATSEHTSVGLISVDLPGTTRDTIYNLQTNLVLHTQTNMHAHTSTRTHIHTQPHTRDCSGRKLISIQYIRRPLCAAF